MGDDDIAISTGNEQRHSLLPSPVRVPKLKGDTCLQQRGGGSRERQVLVEEGKPEGSQHLE